MLLFFLITAQANAKTLFVGKGQEYKSIRAALTASRDGDEVRVIGGTYREGRLIINKKIRLRGIGWPVIRGDGKDDIFFLDADGIIIEGFSVEHSGLSYIKDLAGIKINKRNHCVIRNNRLLKNHFGIYLKNSKDCTIEKNYLSGESLDEVSSGNGIHLWYCSRVKILNNTSLNHRDGIYLEFTDQSTITGNHSENNLRYGLHFMFSNTNSYYGNRFVANGAGVAVMYSRDIIMQNNSFEKNWGTSAYGLLLKDITDSHISHNRFVENSIAVYADGANRNKIEDNDFLSNGWALKILGSSNNNRITRNNFTGNSFDVITNTTANTNDYKANYWSEYSGYDLNHDGMGDVPYRPVKLISMIVSDVPEALLLLRSPLVTLLNFAEKIMPSITPPLLEDSCPSVKMYVRQ